VETQFQWSLFACGEVFTILKTPTPGQGFTEGKTLWSRLYLRRTEWPVSVPPLPDLYLCSPLMREMQEFERDLFVNSPFQATPPISATEIALYITLNVLVLQHLH